MRFYVSICGLGIMLIATAIAATPDQSVPESRIPRPVLNRTTNLVPLSGMLELPREFGFEEKPSNRVLIRFIKRQEVSGVPRLRVLTFKSPFSFFLLRRQEADSFATVLFDPISPLLPKHVREMLVSCSAASDGTHATPVYQGAFIHQLRLSTDNCHFGRVTLDTTLGAVGALFVLIK